MTINTYRVVYRYPDDDVEYAAFTDAYGPDEAARAIMSHELIIIVRVEKV